MIDNDTKILVEYRSAYVQHGLFSVRTKNVKEIIRAVRRVTPGAISILAVSEVPLHEKLKFTLGD